MSDLQNIEQRAEEAAKGLGRMGTWLVLALVALLVVYLLAPQMVKVSLYKLSLLPAATWVLYWIDRAVSERRPHEYFTEAANLRGQVEAMPAGSDQGVQYHALLQRASSLEDQGHQRMLRRVILLTGGMIAVALGS